MSNFHRNSGLFMWEIMLVAWPFFEFLGYWGRPMEREEMQSPPRSRVDFVFTLCSQFLVWGNMVGFRVCVSSRPPGKGKGRSLKLAAHSGRSERARD